MSPIFARLLHNYDILHFGASLEGSKGGHFLCLGGNLTLLLSSNYLCVNFGSDGWNRTTDLGVMNPTL